jgi:imidazolonepropionase-like amidohydrolase
MFKRTVLIIAILFSFTFAQKIYIQCGKLIDGNSSEVHAEKTIVIENDKIVDILDGLRKPADGDSLIDLKDKTVLPGLMDMHTHLSQEHYEGIYSEEFHMNPADYAYRSTIYARRTLLAGFTTVRELGGNISTSLRNAIKKGWVIGPRIFSAGSAIATTGGHADPSNGYNDLLMGDPGPKEAVINGPDEARKAVRQRYKNGADLIKITATGGVLSTARNGQNPQFTDEELKAIIETAKDYDMHVAAHAHGAEGIKRAVRAGVRSIEHGTFMDDEAMDLMKKHGTYYVPTLMAGKWVTEKSKIDGYFPEIVRPKAAQIGPIIQSTFAKAYKNGVKIAFGTDSGVSKHGDNAQEFSLMVEAGMPVMLAIQAATKVSAELLGIQDQLGTIEKGKIADIIAVNENPVDNIATLQNVAFVMKEGKIYKK